MIDLTTAGPRRTLIAVLAALASLMLLAVAETADAKKKKRKRQSAVGLYVGEFDRLALLPGAPKPRLTFQLTPDGTIVDFTITNVPLTCTTEDYDVDTDPNLRRQLDTITAPPMSLGAPLPRRGLPIGLRFGYEDPLPPRPSAGDPPPAPGGPPFRGVHVDGRTFRPTAKLAGDFRGHANLATFNTTRGAVGTEECHLTALGSGSGSTSYEGGFEWFATKRAGPKRSKRKKRHLAVTAKRGGPGKLIATPRFEVPDQLLVPPRPEGSPTVSATISGKLALRGCFTSAWTDGRKVKCSKAVRNACVRGRSIEVFASHAQTPRQFVTAGADGSFDVTVVFEDDFQTVHLLLDRVRTQRKGLRIICQPMGSFSVDVSEARP
jgi:hypothetical protein